MSKLTKRITAMLLSGMLVIGSASGSVYAAAADVDPGLTSEISEEVFTEEPVETSEEPVESAQTSEVAEEVFPEEGTAENTEAPGDLSWSFEESYPEDISVEKETGESNNSQGEVWNQKVIDENIVMSETAQETEVAIDEEGKSENTEVAEEVFVEHNVESDQSENKQTIVPVQNANDAEEDVEETSKDSFDATAEKEEADSTLIESTEHEEEIFSEEASMDEVVSGTCGDNISWVFNDGILRFSGTGKIDGNTVVPDNPFNNLEIKEIIIDEGITEYVNICDCYTSLESLYLPSTLKNIAEHSFQYCENLSKIYVTDIATWLNLDRPGYMRGDLYVNGEKLTELIVPDGFSSIKNSAFWGCTSISSVVLPNSITAIEDFAFCGCENLAFIQLPDGLISIGNQAFFGCSNIENIDIPNGVTEIGDTAFASCTNLKNITIPGTINEIRHCTFMECNELINVEIMQGVAAIGDQAFLRCDSIENIILPEGIKKIEDYAFSGCLSLKQISIPSSVEIVGKGVFDNDKKLKEIHIDDIAAWVSMECKSWTNANIILKGEAITDLVIPDGVTKIREYAFFSCQSLESVIVPEGVLEVCNSAFNNCDSLKSVTLPNSLTSIGESAFAFCDILSQFTIPNNVSYLGGDFLYYAQVYNITVPASVTGIDTNTFRGVSKIIFRGTEKEWLRLTANANLYNKEIYIAPVPVEGIQFDDNRIEIYDEPVEIQANIYPENASVKDVLWLSDSNYISIDENGVITRNPNNDYIEGEARIIAITVDGDFSASCAVYLKDLSVCYKHQWNEDYTVDKEATCTEEGFESIHCSICDAIDENTVRSIPIKNHAYGGWTITKEAGCTETGSREKACVDCGDKITEVIAAVGHTWNEKFTIDKAATYTEEGSESIHCSICNEIKEGSSKAIPKLPKPISMLTVLGIDNITYTGEAVTQEIVIQDGLTKLNYGTDYTVLYSNNTNAGIATVTITGIGDYEGTVKKTFTIDKAPINSAVVIGVTNSTYNGSAQIQSPTVRVGNRRLTEGTDYTLSYANNTNAGTATVMVTGKGNYTGTVSSDFIISPLSFSKVTVTGISSKTYTGSAQTQNPDVKIDSKTLIKDTDYTLSYSNNTNVGIGTVTVTGIGNYEGSITSQFKINKAAQSITAKATASRIAVDKTTTVSITGNKGARSFTSSDTTIATVDKSTGKVTAKKAGTVNITVTAAETANYKAASKVVTIKVVPAATASLKADNQATGIRLTWKKVTGANGYKIYRGSTLIKTITSGSTVTFADTKANTNGTKYTYKVIAKATTGDSTLSKTVAVYRVARPAVSSVTNSAAGKMTVKWGKNAKATGYQIQYSTDKTFKTGNKAVTVAGASAVSKVIGSLTKSKTYYVRIRTYKTVGSTKYWSVWSTVKSVKIAK